VRSYWSCEARAMLAEREREAVWTKRARRVLQMCVCCGSSSLTKDNHDRRAEGLRPVEKEERGALTDSLHVHGWRPCRCIRRIRFFVDVE